ncbi:MAG: histidine kinase dimerization/phospho-acceptor domain-containing protein, partial [Nitriliruptoraceae bacterium]
MPESSVMRQRTEQWRAELVDRMLKVILVLGLLVAVPSMFIALQQGDLRTAVVDVVAVGIVVAVTFTTRLPFATRVWILLVTAVVLGTYLLVAVGLVGHAYLTAYPVMAAVVLGLRPAIIGLGVNAIILAGIGTLGHMGALTAVPNFTSLEVWLLISANFMFLSAVMAVFCALLLRRLETSLAAEHALTSTLEQRQTALEAANADLKRSEAVRLAFLRATSHELRTPLSAIIGLVETLRAHDAQIDDDRRAQLTERLAVNGDRLHRLITDLLDVDRLSAGHVRAMTEHRNLRPLVAQVVDELAIGEHNIALDLIDADVAIDVPKFERVVVNLIANAVRHTPASTTIQVRLFHDGDDVVLQVDDDGPGIDPD